MFNQFRTKISAPLDAALSRACKTYSRLGPGLLFNSVREFVFRPGKRLRPALFLLSYGGFCRKMPAGIYQTAVSFELLHDFFLIHDDIIDRSILRRGKPALHAALNKSLPDKGKHESTGQDLALVAGDIVFTIAVLSFLSIRANAAVKQEALKIFVRSAGYTAAGEFNELILAGRRISQIRQADIYKVYDLKTASYSFSAPLAVGAILAGAPKQETDKLSAYGMLIGRAFQIKDDILGMFAQEEKTGKPALGDLREGKMTLLAWSAWHNSGKAQKKQMLEIMAKKQRAGVNELEAMRRIMRGSGALAYAQSQIQSCLKESERKLVSSRISSSHKSILLSFAKELLSLKKYSLA